MWLVFLFLLLILLGIIFSSINITLKRIEISLKDFDFNIEISFWLFKFIKVINIKLDKSWLTVVGKKIRIDKLRKDKLSFKKLLKFIKDLDFNLSEVDFNLNIGSANATLTILLVVVISTLTTIVLEKNKLKKSNYKILPEFNKFEVLFKGKIKFKLRTIKILKMWYKYMLYKKSNLKYSKTSEKYISI